MMFKRGRVKPSKSSSLFGMIVGIIFVLIGVTSIIPVAGSFGIFWTLFALAIAGFHGYNFFSKKGISHWEVDVETDTTNKSEDFEESLRKLDRLRKDGLITEEEFRGKRQEILDQKW